MLHISNDTIVFNNLTENYTIRTYVMLLQYVKCKMPNECAILFYKSARESVYYKVLVP